MSATEPVTIDLDDPSFQEPVNYDPTQDIDSRQVPPELDLNGNLVDYLFRLSVGENKQQEKKPYPRETQKGTKYLALQVKAQIVAPDEPFDKTYVGFPFGSVSSMVYNGTTSAADLARKLGQQMPSNLSHLDQMAYVSSLLESEPMIPGNIQWSGYCSSCKKEIAALAGEARWPEKKDEQGNVVGHLSVTECQECGSEVSANPKIKKLFQVK